MILISMNIMKHHRDFKFIKITIYNLTKLRIVLIAFMSLVFKKQMPHPNKTLMSYIIKMSI